MKTLTKIMIKVFLIAGLVYAGVMEGYHYFRGQDLDIWRFVLDFFLFGLMMSLMARYKHLRQLRNEQKDL